MNRFIVTTSIYPPSEATLKYAQMKDWTLIIVGDLKTPHDKYIALAADYPNIIYLHPKHQEARNKELSDAIGWNKVMRRNIGFVEAYKLGADIVATVDDDNIPYEEWGQEIIVGKTLPIQRFNTRKDIGVFDPLMITNARSIWHRGFPLDLIRESRDVVEDHSVEMKVLFQADLWDGDPDVDAVCRKIHRPKDLKLICKKEYFPFSSKEYIPFNSQNTFIAREAIPYYMVLPYVGRMDDIWGGYIAQYLLNTRPIFMPPTVWQERNEQSLDKNFEDEVLGYTTTYKLLQDMENWESYLPYQAKRAFEIYRSQFEKEK